jgi:hypothetical protein
MESNRPNEKCMVYFELKKRFEYNKISNMCHMNSV